MAAVSNEELIGSAEAVLNPHTVNGRLFGDVASTLVTDKGNRYCGVCVDTAQHRVFNCRSEIELENRIVTLR